MSQQINLYIEAKRSRNAEFSSRSVLVYLVLVMLGAFAYYGMVQYQTSKMGVMLEDGRRQINENQKKLLAIMAEFSRMRGGLTLEQELKNVSDEAAAQREIIQALKSGALGNVSGYSAYMQAFARQIVQGMWLTGIAIEGDATEMRLQGATMNPQLVPEYIVRLNHEEVMRGKMLTAMVMRHPADGNGKALEVPYLEFDLRSDPQKGESE